MSLQQNVYDLYLLERQVRGLRHKSDAAQRRVKAQERKFEQSRQQETELAGQLMQAKATASSLERQVQEMDELVNKYRDEMNHVRSNKEYSALLLQVNTLKDDRSLVEDQALEHMGLVEQIQQELEGLQQRVVQQEKLVEAAHQEVTSCRDEIGDRLDEVTAQRDDAASKVPDDALAAFKRSSKIHDGDTLAEIVEESRRNMEYSCGGCFISIPVERLNELMSRPDELTFCPSCERILRIGDELRQGLGAKTS